jgi:hypothetical protein
VGLPFQTSCDIRLVAARQALVAKEWLIVNKRNDVNTLEKLLQESELDRGLRFEQIQELTNQLQESELDRGLRFEQIQDLTKLLKESEADRAERLRRIHQLETRLDSVIRRLDRVERTYHALESTFVVRKARLLRLIRIGRIVDPLDHSEKAANDTDCG